MAKARLLDPVVPLERLHPSVASIRTFPGSEPTRHALERAFATFEDTDGNFIEQFQTVAFDARVFELFLHAYFADIDARVHRPKQRPDFLLERGGVTVAVEATTANPSKGEVKAPADLPSLPDFAPQYESIRKALNEADSDIELTPEEHAAYATRIEQEIPIRLGSALYSKLQKEYWKLPEVSGLPFVLAIEAFYAADSLQFSGAGLAGYLYGVKQTWSHDDEGTLNIANKPHPEHRLGAKVIPPHFFAQPGAEHVSAVLFSNSGTSAKFTRMGYQSGFHRGNLVISRAGAWIDPDPNSATPIFDGYLLEDEPFVEEWGHGVTVFHNPNALKPIPHDFFRDATQVYLRGQDIVADGSLFSPYMSRTIVVAYDGDVFEPVDTRPGGVGTILRSEFEALQPARRPSAKMVVRELTWFANRERTILGVVFRDNTDEDYGYALLGRDRAGSFRAIEVESSIESVDDARSQVLQALQRVAATGQTVFEQGDEK